MGIDPELLKELTVVFKAELDEQLQVIIDGLLKIEKDKLTNEERNKLIEAIFRSAHNIKGSARSLGINNIGEIAHKVESLFSIIKKNNSPVSTEITDLCLEAVDKMRTAMQSFIDNKPLTFDLIEILQRLENGLPIEERKLDNVSTDEPKPKIGKRRTDDPTTNSTILKEHETIRVSLDKVDKISSLMEEMQVNKITFNDYYTDLALLSSKVDNFTHLWKQIMGVSTNLAYSDTSENLQRTFHTGNDLFTEIGHSTNLLHKNMRTQVNEFGILSARLEEEIRMLRLIPASTLLCTLPLYVRDLANELGKNVELIINGDQVKMDKMVLEGLRDPLIHLLRNAVDHGIGTPELRKQNNKSITGHIYIDIIDEGNQILIRMSDDGEGIDIKKIGEIAVEKKIITQQELAALSESEILNLIFRQGFSTKEIITSVSGRGVGLDVVKSNLENLKGQVKVSSQKGKHTTFELRVPLTLASERGLMVKCSGQLFVIPTNAVHHVLTIHTKDVIEVEGCQAIILDKRTIPLCALSEILGLPKNESYQYDNFNIIVLQIGWNMVALLIDEIIGEREIVVKSLQSFLTKIPCVAGGTLFESNQVVIVLNAADLLAQSMNVKASSHVTFTADKTVKETKPHILVVDDSITTRTLEKNVLENKNYQVTVAVNGKEAWDLLQKNQYSLLITDVVMPLMDGFTLTENVKKSEKLHDLPVIIVTSLGSDAEKKRGIEVGADAYIVKSEFESGALLEIVSQLV